MQNAVSQSRAADITASEDTSADTRAIPPFSELEGRGYRARKPGNNHDCSGQWVGTILRHAYLGSQRRTPGHAQTLVQIILHSQPHHNFTAASRWEGDVRWSCEPSTINAFSRDASQIRQSINRPSNQRRSCSDVDREAHQYLAG